MKLLMFLPSHLTSTSNINYDYIVNKNLGAGIPDSQLMILNKILGETLKYNGPYYFKYKNLSHVHIHTYVDTYMYVH